MGLKFALIGSPIGHSVSPYIHAAGLKSLGLDGTYEALDTPAEDLIQRIKYLKVNDYKGFNITIPLKVPMKLFLDGADELANVSGCVNTILIRDDKSFYGYNTDVYGFKTAIPEDIQKSLKSKSVSIIGTGGASRAAVVAFTQLGVAKINLFTRNIINASELVKYYRETFPNVEFNIFQKSSTGELFKSAMIVNASPVGMKGYSADEMPLSLQVLYEMPKDVIIYDIVYNPIKTKLIEKSKEFGLQTISGLDMLVYQAQKAIEIWTGKEPNFDKMKIAALENL
ncbi:MAG: shikimate dehydrogenase [bacterium]|nr:shikimate dehydrogenase [bacterium]